MRTYIDGRAVGPEDVTFPDLNFGVGGVETPFEYVIEISLAEFISRFGVLYDACVEELKRDAELVGETEFFFPLSELLRNGGEPALSFVDSQLRQAIFEEFFPSDMKATFALHTLDSVETTGSLVLLKGRARHVGRH